MTKIEPEQANVLKDFKKLIGKTIPILDDVFIKKYNDNYYCGAKVESGNIIELTIGDYELATLPESISNLKSLQILSLARNSLKTLPESIGELKSLKTLYLKTQRLFTLPESIGNLQSLQTLVVNYRLKTLPESIGNLKSLQKLSLGGNSLTTLPDSIGNLQSLRELSLAKNKFTTLPESIGNLNSLEKLYLTDNQLTTLPDSLWRLKALTELDLKGNPWGSECTRLQKSSNTIPRMLELWRHRAPITVFVSYSREDEERFLIEQMKYGLKVMPEIREVYSDEESEILESHLFLFIVTKNSINNKRCQNELISSITHKINIIPLKAPDIKWEDLSNINLGMDYNMGEKLGIEFEEKNTAFFLTLYDHIMKYKRQINLLEPMEGRIDKQWLNAKIISDNFVNSEEFREFFRENIDQFKKLAEEFKDGHLSPKQYIIKTGQILK